MSPNDKLLLAAVFALGVSSGGFFFAQFSRSTKNVERAIQSSGVLFLLGAGALAAAFFA